MSIRLFFEQTHIFGPDELAVLVVAFLHALRELQLSDLEDPVALILAKRIIETAKRGERNPASLRDNAIEFLRSSRRAPDAQ